VKEEHLEVDSTPTHSSAAKPVQRKRKLENANDSFAPPAKTPLQKTPAKGSVPVKSPIPTSAKSKVKTPSTPLHTPTQSSATAKTPTTAKTTASVKTPATAKSSGKPKVESHSSLTPNIPTSIGLTPSKPSAKTPLKVWLFILFCSLKGFCFKVNISDLRKFNWSSYVHTLKTFLKL
jgi:hypothetical protein